MKPHVRAGLQEGVRERLGDGVRLLAAAQADLDAGKYSGAAMKLLTAQALCGSVRRVVHRLGRNR